MNQQHISFIPVRQKEAVIEQCFQLACLTVASLIVMYLLQTTHRLQQKYICTCTVFLPFLSPASRSEEGGLLNSPSSVRPSVRPAVRPPQIKIFVCSYAHSFPHLFSKKHHYINKAGDSRATCTLVHFYLHIEQDGGDQCAMGINLLNTH